VTPTHGGRCGIGTTVQVSLETSWSSCQFVHSATSIDVKMEKEGFLGRNVHLHHYPRYYSMEKGTARTTNLHFMPSSFLSQTLDPSRYHTRGRYGEGPARGAIVQYCRMGSFLRKFIEQTRALESMPVGMVRHLLRTDEFGQVLCEDLGD
jgi:hypothetical protein